MSPLFFVNAPARLAIASRSSRSAACTRRRTWTACDTAAPVLTPEEIESQFSRLNHVNPNLRKKASSILAINPSDEITERLVALLDLEDTAHRRAAVQALGMTGLSALKPVIGLLQDSPNSTVRASCSKVIAAVALYFPEARMDFPSYAIEALERALKEDPDPVTQLATVGALGTLGSDIKQHEGDNSVVLAGCERAVEILVGVCRETKDIAVGATAVGAIAQIGQNGTQERKQRIIAELEKVLQTEGGEEEGLGYVREIVASHLDQLKGGVKGADE